MKVLEDETSIEFKAAVAEEDARWSYKLAELPTSALTWWRRTMAAMQAAAHPETPRFAHAVFEWCGRTVRLQNGAAGYTANVWIGGWSRKALAGIGFGDSGSGDGWFYTQEDVGSGAEDLELSVWHWGATASAPRLAWRRRHVGPTVGIRGDSLYFTNVENLLRYPDVCRVDLQTGRGVRTLFREPDKRIQVSIIQRDEHIFVHTANALEQRVGIVEARSVRWLTPVLESTLVPITPTMIGCNDHLLEVSSGRRLPLPAGTFIEDARHVGGVGIFVATVRDGQDQLWLLTGGGWSCICGDGDSGGLLRHIEIIHEPTALPTFLIRSPIEPDRVAAFDPAVGKLRTVLKFPEPLRLREVCTGAADTARVPYMVVSAVARPRKLLVEAYGAYGISARRAYPVRWLAWLKAGYAVATVCPRGGREKGDAWYDGGRTAARKHQTFEDTAAAIAAIQRRCGIAAAATVFFGRSAGGWLAANIAQEHGSLVGAVYAEVPYVDVLATTGNPTLPLTQLEYDEFGNSRVAADARALKKISPVDTVPVCKSETACPLLVIRTGLHDKQVLPYEVLKWARHLRMAGWTRVYVGIDHDGGHFAAAKPMLQQRAEDAAIIDAGLQSSKKRSTRRQKRAKPVSSRGATGSRGAGGKGGSAMSGRSRTRRR